MLARYETDSGRTRDSESEPEMGLRSNTMSVFDLGDKVKRLFINRKKNVVIEKLKCSLSFSSVLQFFTNQFGRELSCY